MSEQETSQDAEATAPGDAESAAGKAAETPSANGEAGADNGETGAGAKKTRGRKSTAKKTRTVELTLTVTGTAEGEWQADLLHSGKRVVQGLPIPAAAVSKAAAELHGDIAETIQQVIDAAREQHEAKLAELEAEVERVRKALSELDS